MEYHISMKKNDIIETKKRAREVLESKVNDIRETIDSLQLALKDI